VKSVDRPSDPKTYAVIGAAMEVHRQLGSGFLEAVYQAAMVLELSARKVPFQREVELAVFYKGQKLDVSYRADFICYDKVVVELKALSELSGVEESQLINYLKATGHDTGLLVNFGAKSLDYKRFTTKPILNPQITPIKEDSGVSSPEAKGNPSEYADDSPAPGARNQDHNLCKSVESVDRTPGPLSPPITPIKEDSVCGSQTPGRNLCKSVESVDRTPGPLSPPITLIKEDSVCGSQTPERNLCKSVESVDRTPGSRSEQSVRSVEGNL
jgi:GxxExxY protein